MVRNFCGPFFLKGPMDKYIQIEISQIDETASAIAIAELSQIGFDGFLEETSSLKAYCKEPDLNKNDLIILMNKLGLTYSLSVLESQNWNALWESNFSPVLVDNFVGIRASFHEPIKGVEHELIITPKMSFGTGHHATTYSVMQLMREIHFETKKVFDFGTGTGILAILAERLGASFVLAVDNDPWCIDNSQENILINECKNIEIQQVDSVDPTWRFDVVIANINRHIIEANMASLPAILVKNGQLILSGLLETDEADMIKLAENQGFIYQRTIKKDGWIALLLTK